MTEHPDRPDVPSTGSDERSEPDDRSRESAEQASSGTSAAVSETSDAAAPSPAASRAAIDAFWAWWQTFGDEAAKLVASGEPGDLERFDAEITPKVKAIHPDLSWEVHPAEAGPDAAAGRHVLTLSGGGDPRLRALTERWVRAGEASERFVFRPAHQARPASLTGTLRHHDHELDLSHAAFGVRLDRRRVRFEVAVYHPDFLFLSEEEQHDIAGIVMRLMLGEDDVARWVGPLRPAVEKPVDALPAEHVRVVVADVAERYRRPGWAEVSGMAPDGRPLVGRTLFPLRRVDFPLCELHVALAVPYKQRDRQGLPGKRAEAALRGFEEVLVGGLGDDGVLAAHITGDGSRVFHLYVDPESGATDRIAARAGEWDQGRPQLQAAADPEWNGIAAFLT